MKIAICDDERKFAERLAGLIEEPEAEIFMFGTGSELLRSNTEFDIILLDIEMPDMNGLEIAAELMKKNKKCILVFVTSHSQYSTKGYEFRAFRYVLKSEPDEFIKRNINDAIDEHKGNNFTFTISGKHEIAKLYADDILYIEAFGHKVIVHTRERDYTGNERFNAVYQTLMPYGFVQCHKSYAVNVRHISSIKKGAFVNLTNEIKIPIGRKYNTEVIEKYLEFEGRRG